MISVNENEIVEKYEDYIFDELTAKIEKIGFPKTLKAYKDFNEYRCDIYAYEEKHAKIDFIKSFQELDFIKVIDCFVIYNNLYIIRPFFTRIKVEKPVLKELYITLLNCIEHFINNEHFFVYCDLWDFSINNGILSFCKIEDIYQGSEPENIKQMFYAMGNLIIIYYGEIGEQILDIVNKNEDTKEIFKILRFKLNIYV